MQNNFLSPTDARRTLPTTTRAADDRAATRADHMPISLWLLPPNGLNNWPPSEKSHSTRSSLIQMTAPIAAANLLPESDPHVTIIGDTGVASEEDALKMLQQLKGAGRVAIEFTELGAGVDEASGTSPWNQSAVAIVKETPQLVALQRHALLAFKGAEAAAKAPLWAPPLQKAHLSLAYGNKPEVLSRFTLPPPFIAEHLALWQCTPATLEGVPTWKEIARVAL